MESQFYGDGQHNGGVYNSGNLNPYIYTYNNPIRYIDPNGKQVGAWEIPLAYYVFTGIAAAIASYQISQAVSNVKFSTPIERPIFREEVPATSPKITIEQLFKDKEKSLEVEIFPPAKKDNLIVRTIPQASPQKINILNADDSNDDKKKVGNTKIGDIVQTPDSNAINFNKRRDGTYVNKKTGEVWSKSYTQHSGNEEWKVGIGLNVPTKNNKITVSREDRKVLKVDKSNDFKFYNYSIKKLF